MKKILISILLLFTFFVSSASFAERNVGEAKSSVEDILSDAESASNAVHIYAVGNGHLIKDTLEAVVMIFSDVSYAWLAAAALLFGLLVSISKGLLSGKGEEGIRGVFYMLIAFMILFGVKTDVIVHQGDTKELIEVVISNPGEEVQIRTGVPIGISGMAAFASTVGYEMHSLIKTFLSVNEGTTGGLNGASAAKIMSIASHYRGKASSMTEVSQMKVGNETYNVSGSLSNWYASCYYPWVHLSQENSKLDLRYKSGNFFENIWNGNPDAVPALEALPLLGGVVEVSLPGISDSGGLPRNSAIVSCNMGSDNATKLLYDVFEGTYKSSLTSAFNRQNAKELVNRASVATMADMVSNTSVYGCSSSNAEDKANCMVETASQQLMGHSRAGYEMMAGSYIAAMSEDGLYQYANQTDNKSMVAALDAARVQRNQDSSAALTMFTTLIPPLLSFFEMFLYAVAPFVALMFLTGLTGGFQALNKYFQMYFWIALWFPILAIGNYYIDWQISESMLALAYQQASITGSVFVMPDLVEWSSIADNPMMLQALQEAGHISAMMMVATPILALMIVTGSYYAMNTIATRMSGADNFNEGAVAPDTIKNDSMVSGSGVGTTEHHNQGFRHATGEMETFSLGNALTNNVNQQQAVVDSVSHSTAAAMNNAYSNGINSSNDDAFQVSYRNGVTYSSTSTGQEATKLGDDFNKTANTMVQKSLKMTEDEKRTFDTKLQANAGAGKVVGMTAGGSFSSAKAQQDLLGLGLDEKTASQITEGFTKENIKGLKVDASSVKDLSASQVDKISESDAIKNDQNLSKAWQKQDAATNSYSAAKSSAENLSNTKQKDEAELVQWLSDTNNNTMSSLVSNNDGFLNDDEKARLNVLRDQEKSDLRRMGVTPGAPNYDDRVNLRALSEFSKETDNEQFKEKYYEDVLAKGLGVDNYEYQRIEREDLEQGKEMQRKMEEEQARIKEQQEQGKHDIYNDKDNVTGKQDDSQKNHDQQLEKQIQAGIFRLKQVDTPDDGVNGNYKLIGTVGSGANETEISGMYYTKDVIDKDKNILHKAGTASVSWGEGDNKTETTLSPTAITAATDNTNTFWENGKLVSQDSARWQGFTDEQKELHKAIREGRLPGNLGKV